MIMASMSAAALQQLHNNSSSSSSGGPPPPATTTAAAAAGLLAAARAHRRTGSHLDLLADLALPSYTAQPPTTTSSITTAPTAPSIGDTDPSDDHGDIEIDDLNDDDDPSPNTATLGGGDDPQRAPSATSPAAGGSRSQLSVLQPSADGVKKKRQRASTSQLAILEAVFAETPNPSSTVRKELAEKCGMRERSVQIWFQNRRARIKGNGKKGSEEAPSLASSSAEKLFNSPSLTITKANGTSSSVMSSFSAPNSSLGVLSAHASPITPMSQFPGLMQVQTPVTPAGAIPQLFQPILPPLNIGGLADQRQLTPQSLQAPMRQQIPSPAIAHQELSLHHQPPPPGSMTLPIHSLMCGSWRRTLNRDRNDLSLFAIPHLRVLIMGIESGSLGFRIEIPFDEIAEMNVELGPVPTPPGVPSPPIPPSHLVIRVTHVPTFLMQVDATAIPNPPQPIGTATISCNVPGARQIWARCSDFTEHAQASTVPFYRLTGALELKQLLASICESDERLADVGANVISHVRMLNSVPGNIAMQRQTFPVANYNNFFNAPAQAGLAGLLQQQHSAIGNFPQQSQPMMNQTHMQQQQQPHQRQNQNAGMPVELYDYAFDKILDP